MSPTDPDVVAFVAVAAFSLCIGSFLNVVVYRLPRMLERDFRREATATLAEAPAQPLPPDDFNLAKPRSHCTNCGRMVRSYENLPIISWLLLRRRCAGCGSKISMRYPLVETLTALLSLVVLWRFGVTETCALALLFTWCMVALAAIDLDTFFLPDSITLPLLWIGLLGNMFAAFAPLDSAVWGAVLGYLCLWSIFWVFKLLTGKEGMGYGDFKLLGAIGAWLGWNKLLTVIIVSSASGAIIGIAMIALRRTTRAQPIPFGPFLAAAGWIVMIWGDQLADAYFRIL